MIAWQLLGTGLAAGGVSALYVSWKGSARNWPLVLIGWGMILGCVLAWAKTSGVDKGPALGLIVFMLVALLGVLIAAYKTPLKTRRMIPPREAVATETRSVWRIMAGTTGAVLSLIFLGLIVSLAVSTAIFMANRAAGLEHTANLTWSMFSFPMAWAVISVFLGYAQSRASKAIWLGGALAISTVVIAITMQGA